MVVGKVLGLILLILILFCMQSCGEARPWDRPTVLQEKTMQPRMDGVPTLITSDIPEPSTDLMEPSQDPPGGLRPEQVPQYVSLGFDDNGVGENIDWLLGELSSRRNPPGRGQKDTFDGTPLEVAFYLLGSHGVGMVSWQKAYEAGHEIGNHSFNHPHGRVWTNEGKPLSTMPLEGWRAEMQKTFIALERLGIPRREVRGYRQPYLEASTNSLLAVAHEYFRYDCSLEEGFQEDQSTGSYFWPYTLHGGSPGNPALEARIKGLWEVPVYALMVPPALQEKVRKLDPGMDQAKITGFDYNLWTLYQLEPEEFTQVLNYNLDLALAGNRAPFTFGTHSDDYGAMNPGRRKALLDFIDYALSKPEVRFVGPNRIIDWMKAPRGL